MSRKNKIIIGTIIIFTVVAVSGFAITVSGTACRLSSGFGNPPGHGFRFHGRGMPPFMHAEIGKFILWRMDRMADTLNLNDSQQGHFNKLKANIEITLEKGLLAKQQMREDIRQELDKQSLDILVITSSIQSRMNTMADMMDTNLTLFSTLYTSLDEDQKGILNQKIKERFEATKGYYSCNESGNTK